VDRPDRREAGVDGRPAAADRPRRVAREACAGRREEAGGDDRRGRPGGRAAVGPGSSHRAVGPGAEDRGAVGPGVDDRRRACRGAVEQRPAAGAGNHRVVCPVEGAGSRLATGSERRFDHPADPGHRGAYLPRHRPGRPRSATAALRHVACRHAGRSRKGPPRPAHARARFGGRTPPVFGYGDQRWSGFTPPRSSGVASEFSDHAFPGRMTAPGGSNYMCGRLPRRTR
jgi:hypothetical protein